MEQARLNEDDLNRIDNLANMQLQSQRFNLMKTAIKQFLEDMNKELLEQNEKITLNNRYAQNKIPLNEMIDIKAILEDFQQYEKEVNSFSPLNKYDNFEMYFKTNILSKDTFFINNFGPIEMKHNKKQAIIDYFIYNIFNRGRYEELEKDFIHKTKENFRNDSLKANLEKLTSSLQISNIKETKVNHGIRYCTVNVKLSGKSNLNITLMYEVKNLKNGDVNVKIQ